MNDLPDDTRSQIDQAEAILSGYGAVLDVADLSLGPGLSVLLVLDGEQVFLELDLPASAFQLHRTVGRVPLREQASFYKRLLLGNYFQVATQGATLSIDPSTDDVVLSRLVPLQGLDAAHLAALVDQFITTASHWNGLFASGQLLQPVDASTTREPARGYGDWRA